MMENARELTDSYIDWLKERTVLRELDGWVEITAPYLDRHNDYLQIYVTRDEGDIVLSDDAYTLHDLEQSGCRLETPKRKSLLEAALLSFGIERVGDELRVRTSETEFARKKHNLLQGMLAINDLFYLAQPTVTSVFLEDVAAWLDTNEVRYIPDVKLTGKSGYDHKFDFMIPKSKSFPERVVSVLNNPSSSTAKNTVFKWLDTRQIRTDDSRAYAFLNDRSSSVPESAVGCLESYDISPVLWSERDSVRDELAA